MGWREDGVGRERERENRLRLVMHAGPWRPCGDVGILF